MDKTVNKTDLSLVPEIRSLHPAFFHSFHQEKKPQSPGDSPDLELVKHVVPGFLERIQGILKDNVKSLFTTFIVVLVVLLETAGNRTLFKCPCTTKRDNVGYSMLFVTAPSVALFIIGWCIFFFVDNFVCETAGRQAMGLLAPFFSFN